MLEVTSSAQHYLRRLLQQQGDDDFGILVAVSAPGTPAARVDLGMCEPTDLGGEEVTLACEGFQLHVAAASVPWLEHAQIDFDERIGGGRMRITAPGICGDVPDASAGLAAKLCYLIDSEINPQLASHGGQVELLAVDPGNIAVLRFGGGCHGCGMVDVTLKQGVEKTLCKHLPELGGVRDATEHAKGERPYYKGRDGASAMR